MKYLVSIHDVMPSTRDDVSKTLGILADNKISSAYLLVVPGSGWDAEGITWLKSLQKAGHHLVGHGWHHNVAQIRGFKHRLHSMFISKNVAEHLALNSQEIYTLIQNCFNWFKENGLNDVNVYVPPAWARGDISNDELQKLPFRYYEFLNSVYDSSKRQSARIPMLGYEAMSSWQVMPVRLWNAWNHWRGHSQGIIRLGVHPADYKLRLRKDLLAVLARVEKTANFSDCFADG